MKLQNLFLTLFAAAVMMVGCGPKEDPQPALPVLNVGQTELTFEQGGGTATLTVTSNRPWTITSDADWIAFNPSSGSAADAPVNVTVTALANSSTDRTSSFRVKTDFDYKTVSVSQKGSKGEDPNQTATGSGTANDPYNVFAAIQKAKSLVAFNSGDEANSENSANVYTKGKVVSVEIDPSYGNATYYISADGTTETQLEVYRGKYLGGANFLMKDQLKVGDEVVVYGTIVNFKGNTPEYTTGSKLISINGNTEAPAIDFTKFELITVKSFIEKADNGQFFRLKGKVSRFNKQYCSFDLTDESGTVYVYSVNNKEDWSEKISNGGTVELAGLYTYFEKNEQHEVVSAQILSFEPGSGGGDHSDAVAKTVKDFISTADNNTYFKLTGTVSGFNSQYCSFDLTDATGKIYVYSVANKDAWSSKIANGGTVTLAGKYDYYATKEQHEVIEAEILSFTPGEAPDAKSATVAEAIAAEKNAVLKVGPALVVASASAGFLMEQDGARIYVYGGSAVVGDNVTVTGTKAEYGEAPQLTNPAVVVNSKGTKVTYPDAKDITSTADSYKSTTREFISVKGKLSVSDRYFNVEITGATTVTGSIVKPVEDIAALDGKDVTIKGYYLYHTSSKDGKKYLYVIATDINGTAITGEGGGSQGGGDDTPGGDVEGGEITWTSSSSWTGVEEKAQTISLKAGSYTITAVKSSGKTNPTVNGSSNDCRVYASGKITIETTGEAMTSIVFNISSQGLKRLAKITSDTGTVATQNKGDKTVKWSGSAKSVTFTVGDTADFGSESDKAGQFDFSSIVIK